MLLQSSKRFYRLVLAMLTGLFIVTATDFSAVARAEDQALTDMSFSLSFLRDINDYYIITVGCQNDSLGRLNQVYALLPLDSRLEYQYYTSDSKDSYVRRGVPERLEVAFSQVKPGKCVAVQIYFKRVPNSRGSWTVSATGHWDGEPSINGAISNSLTIDLNGKPNIPQTRTLVGGGTVKPGDRVPFSGEGYFSKETVSLWINLADGRVQALQGSSSVQADSDGKIGFILELSSNIPPGPTSLVAYGQSSKLTSLGYMNVVT